MITLYIDTSDKDVSIAIIKDQKKLIQITKDIPYEHSIYTVPFIKEALTNCNLKVDDIDNIMVVNGPGSFTGIRIGITIAKVYAYLLNKEIRTVSALKALALSQKAPYILSLIDAKHNNYYLGLYDSKYNEIVKEQFANLDLVTNLINKYNPQIVTTKDLTINNINYSQTILNIPRIVTYYLKKPTENPHKIIPNYLKLPEALEKKND